MQLGNIVLTKVDESEVTLAPLQKDGLLITYGDTSGEISDLSPSVSLGFRGTSRSNNIAKTTVRLSVPFSRELVDGTTTTEYVSVYIDVLRPATAPKDVVSDVVGFASQVIIDPQVKDTIVNNAFPY